MLKGVMRTLLFAFVLGFCLTAMGQTGAMQGTVQDPSGAVVAGAALKAVNVNTGATFETVSNDAGLFRLPVLPVGTYDVTVSRAGFATVIQKGIVITVGSNPDVPFGLQLATKTEQLEVTGEAPIVETARSAVAATVDERNISNLPVNGRNFMDFVLLTPGVTRDPRTGDISFAGQRGTLNSLQIDGADNNNTFFGQTTGRTGSGRAPYQFSEDAVQEFQVNSNSYSAEYGRAGGAVVNVVTKSGSNTFHGTAFEFFRDRAMNANDFINKIFNRPKGAYHYHQFGGNVGGPIKRDKLFFFFDYDGQRNTQQNLVTLNLPRGFAFSTNPATAAQQQAAVAYLTPLASSWNKTFNQNVYLTKIDWHISPRNILSGRWNRQNFAGNGLESSGNVAFEHTGASNVATDTITGQLTSTLTNTVVNVARLGYLRDNEPGFANGGNPEGIVKEAGVTVLTIGRNNFSPRFTNIHRVQGGDTISFVHGRHSLKTGVDMIGDRIANFFPGFFSGQYTFNSLADFGDALNGNWKLGVVSGDKYQQSFAGTGTPGPTTHPDRFEFASFIQDDWRATNTLTLNLGLRYDLGNKVQPPVLNPSAALQAAGIATDQAHNDHLNFGPRVGFAWDPTATHRMVVRGGYGMFYGRTPSIMLSTAISTNGISVVSRSFSTAAPVVPNKYPNNICGGPPSGGDSPSCAPPTTGASAPTIFVFAPNYHEPMVQQGNFGVEYALTGDLALSVNYIYVHGSRLSRTRDINLSAPTAASILIAGTGQSLTFPKFPTTSSGAPIRPIAGFDRIDQFESSASSIYNGLTFGLTKRFSHNFQGMASYTWGHVIDTNPDATAVVPGNAGDDSKIVFNQFDPGSDRGNGLNDQRQRFVLSGVWQVGNYANHLSALPRAVLGGWEASFIFTAQSGQPYTAHVSSDLNGDGNQFNDRVADTGRNAFYTPNRITLDPRITRTVSLTERAKVQLIWEAFNVFNRANYVTANDTFYTLSTSASVCGVGVTRCLVAPTGTNAFAFPRFTADFGQVGNRVMQIAAKIVF